jgi:hypothetical protein
MSHKFAVGQVVAFTPDAVQTPTATATIIRLLPKQGAEYQYHVQIETDGLLRRAWESQLRAED